jgi:ribulose-phosphate 3-epimerase
MIEEKYSAGIIKKLYRERFLLGFVLIGFVSLIVEIVFFRGLESVGFEKNIAYFVGFFAGLLFAYWFNVRFNFKIPRAKRRKAFILFLLISLISGCLNYGFRIQLKEHGFQFESARFLSSGITFLFVFFLHRRFTFIDRKKVGIAVYANGLEDIKKIFLKVKSFPDFIHVDIIDSSFGEFDLEPKAYRLETIKAYWPEKPLHVHLMTKFPLRWLPDVLPFAETVFFHIESNDSASKVIKEIKKAGRLPGISLLIETPINQIMKYLADCNNVLLLAIKNPGRSGQVFDYDILEKVKALGTNPIRKSISVCVDGGVNENTNRLLNVEMVVSGSFVLSAKRSCRNIMKLQNTSNFEAI